MPGGPVGPRPGQGQGENEASLSRCTRRRCNRTAGDTPTAHGAVQPNVTCGQVITASITLNTNLNCADTALFTSNTTPITVNLNGHSIKSPPTNLGSPLHHCPKGNGGTTVQNGKIVGGGGSNLVPGPHLYQNVTIDGGSIDTFADKHVAVLNSRFINGAGVTSAEDSVDIENSTFEGSASHGVALYLYSTSSTVLNNTITGYGTGIALGGDLSGANLQGNHIFGAPHGDGIQIAGVDPQTDRIPGIVSNNVSSNNAGDGIVLYDGSGITRTPGLVVSNNTTNGNDHDGIHVDAVRHTAPRWGLT